MSKDFLHKLSYNKNQSEFQQKYVQPQSLFPAEDLKYKSLYAEHVEIMRILHEENFNKTRTAERLNINRKTLYNKLKTFDMINAAER